MNNIDRCLNWNGHLRRKQRETFENFRHHPNERVRRYVKQLEARWAVDRQLWRELRDQEEIWEDEMLARAEVEAEDDELDVSAGTSVFDEESEIPF